MRQIIFLPVIIFIFLGFLGCAYTDPGDKNASTYDDPNYVFDRFASSEDFQLTITSHDGSRVKLTTGYQDYKPSWSRDGKRLTFFRMLAYEEGFGISKTMIGVINSDGTDLGLLTSGEHADFNPTWTRDGSNMILFTRYDRKPRDLMRIYMIAPDGSSGDEILISDPSPDYSEWAASGLKDGRIFIDRIGWKFQSFLLTPVPGQIGKYEEIQRGTGFLWHKLSVSPSEKRVAYMRYGQNDRPFEDAVICYADFDLNKRIISNHVQIVDADPDCVFEYPRWSRDEKYIIFDSNRDGKFQIYAYRLADGHLRKLSKNPNADSMYGNFEGLPK